MKIEVKIVCFAKYASKGNCEENGWPYGTIEVRHNGLLVGIASSKEEAKKVARGLIGSELKAMVEEVTT